MANEAAMAHILTQQQQEDCLSSIVQVTLDNFSMTWRLLDLLIKNNASKPPPRATILLRGEGLSADIPGTNCGFFVIPVVNMAVLDCRRSLEFFGLTCDHGAKCLRPISNRRPDDLGIEHFGLSLVSPAQFLSAASPVISGPLEPIVVQVHHCSNKELAHFTLVQAPVTYQSLRNISVAMIEAYMKLLFDALGRPRPALNPSPT
jgi:hypothetical protein